MRREISCRTFRAWDASRRIASMGQCEVQIQADGGRAEPIRGCGHGGLSGAYTMGTLFMGKKNSIQIRHAQLKYLSVGLKLKLTGPSDLILVTYPT